MHEMSYVVRFVNLAINTAEQSNAKSVSSITVSVGEMTDVLPEYLQRYYPQVVKGTILEKSKLILQKEPVTVKCLSCGETYHPTKENDYRCPACGSFRGKALSGRDVRLVRIEAEI